MSSSIGNVSQSLGGITGNLNAQTISTMDDAAGVQGRSDALSEQAANIALYNMYEAFQAQSWAAGIKTEKGLLSKGVALAKA